MRSRNIFGNNINSTCERSRDNTCDYDETKNLKNNFELFTGQVRIFWNMGEI